MEIEDTNTIEQTVTETPVVNTEVETPAVEETKVQDVKFFKSFKTEEDWKNYETSLNNKYSTNMLKEFNVASVKELHDTISNYQNQLTALQSEISGLKQESALSSVDDEFKDDALAIAQAKCAKNPDLTLNEAVSEVLAKNPTWSKGQRVDKLGTERNPSTKTAKNSDGVLNAFLKRNPNLKGSLLNEDN